MIQSSSSKQHKKSKHAPILDVCTSGECMTNNFHSIISGWIKLSPGLVSDWDFPQLSTIFEEYDAMAEEDVWSR